MRQVTSVLLALLLCASNGWAKVDAAARRANQELARQLQQYWNHYQSALDAAYFGDSGSWHALVVDKVFLQTALRDARAKVDRRDPGSARRLDALRTRIQRLFDEQEAELRDAILGKGARRLQPERKE